MTSPVRIVATAASRRWTGGVMDTDYIFEKSLSFVAPFFTEGSPLPHQHPTFL
jgi:hypothetical protein